MSFLERLDMTVEQIPITLLALMILTLFAISDHDTTGHWTYGWIFGTAIAVALIVQLCRTA